MAAVAPLPAEAALLPGISIADYEAIDAVNVSRLKNLRHSPLHYRHGLTHSKRSAALTRGTAAHVATLEWARFEDAYAVWDRRTESGRIAPRTGRAWEEFAAANAGREILTDDERRSALAIALAVRSDPIAAQYLEVGAPELAMTWCIGERRCKGRIDWLTDDADGPVIVGLKTARDCRPLPFGAAAARLGYHLQWAWYADGYQVITGHAPRMVEIVVEPEAPHAVVVYRIPDDVLEQGRDEYEQLLGRLDECERANEWPGPASREETLTLPSWVYGSDDDLSELGLEIT